MAESNDRLSLVGEVELVLRGPDGRVKQRVTRKNLVVTTGKEAVVDQLVETPALAKPKYIAIGKGATAPAEGNTALVEEAKRKEATTRSRSGATLTMAVVFGPGEGTGKIQEAGVLTANAGGTLYSRTTFGAIEKEAADSLEAIWKLTAT